MTVVLLILRSMKTHWRLLVCVLVAASIGFGAGQLAGAGKRAELAEALTDCARAEAAAAVQALESQGRLAGENARRLEDFGSRLSGAVTRAEQIGREPREIVYRVECLADDADLERLCRIAPDHPDCADQLR